MVDIGEISTYGYLERYAEGLSLEKIIKYYQ